MYAKTNEIMNFSNNIPDDILITDINELGEIANKIDQEYVLVTFNIKRDHRPVYFHNSIGSIYPYYTDTIDIVIKNKKGIWSPIDKKNITSAIIRSSDYIGTNILYDYNYYYGDYKTFKTIYKKTSDTMYIDKIEILENDLKDNSKVLYTFNDLYSLKELLKTQIISPTTKLKNNVDMWEYNKYQFYIFRFRKVIYYKFLEYDKKTQELYDSDIDIKIRRRIKSAR